jgi:hypothetical protein
LLPGFSGKGLRPALGGKRSQPGIATLGFVCGKDFYLDLVANVCLLDLVAKICYLHLAAQNFATGIWWLLDLVRAKNLCNLDLVAKVAKVRNLDLVALGFVSGKNLLPGFGGKCLS